MRARRLVRAGLTTCAVALLAACGTSASPSASHSPVGAATGRSAAPVAGTVTVFAAASLEKAFTALGRGFEQAHPGTEVTFSFGPSSGLATSITQGAPVDVFAAASPKTMDQVVAAGLASDPRTFAQNVMQVAVPAANPAHIAALADLARPGVKVALCQPQVPCGAVAAEVFANAGLRVTPVSEEVDVTSVLTKVSLGEVDAGVVYVTDIRSAGPSVKGIDVPAAVNASTAYPIVTLTRAPNRSTAAAFTAYVLSADGRAVLAAGGFAKP